MTNKLATVVMASAISGFAAAVLLVSPADAAKKPNVRAAHGHCVTKLGRGWAPTLEMAKFQAWEIVAQKSGNWPVATDKLVNERYTCKPEGGMVRCDSKIDVCKS